MGFFRLVGKWSPERLVLSVPAVGLGTVALSFGFGGGPRPIVSAQVYGGPTDAAGPWSGRVLVVRELDDELAPVGDELIEVTRRGPRGEAHFQGRTGSDGWLEVSLPDAGDGAAIDLTVRRVLGGALLARGRPTFLHERWVSAARRGLTPPQRQKARLSIEGAVLAVPFESKLELSPLGCSEDEPHGFEREWLSASGASLLQAGRAEPAERLILQGSAGLSIAIRPREHVVGIERGCARVPGAAALAPEVSLTMPVVPGALHVKKLHHGLLIEAPTPTSAIWYTFVTEEQRLRGGRLSLEATPSGGARGTLKSSFIPEARGLYLVVATSADGRSPSTVGYPLDGQENTFDAIDGFLMDGAPAAEARERERRRRVVRALLGYVAALFALSLWLFWLVVHRADAKLLSDLRRGEAPAGLLRPLGARPSFVAGVAIAFGLSLVLLWIAVYSEAG